MYSQKELANGKIKEYNFLEIMYQDPHFPDFLVDKCKIILVDLCFRIEKEKPSDLEQLYRLTHEATKKINNLEDEFYDNGSEIETVARECIAEDFYFIAKAYNYEPDIEKLIAPRTW